jgi:hypothetical protein
LQPHVNFICTLNFEVLNFSEKMTWFATYLVLWTELSTCQSTNLKRTSTNLKRRWLDLLCSLLSYPGCL